MAQSIFFLNSDDYNVKYKFDKKGLLNKEDKELIRKRPKLQPFYLCETYIYNFMKYEANEQLTELCGYLTQSFE